MAIISTKALLEAHLEMRAPKSFLLKTFWGGSSPRYFKQQKVDVDIYKGQRKIAPYVTENAQGITMEKIGFTTWTIEPAKVSIKKVLDRSDATAKQPGYPVTQDNGQSDAALRDTVARNMAELEDYAERTEELQARDALLTGTATLRDVEGNTLATLNYQRDSALTLTAGALWNDTGSDPISDLDTWRRLIIQKSDIRPDKVIFSASAWEAFREHASVQTSLNLFNGNQNSKTVYENMENGAVYHGIIEGLELWTYDEWYVDSNGTEQPMMTAGKVLLASSSARRDRCYAAVFDPEVQALIATDRHFRSYIQNDPAASVLQMESYPLLVPTAVNASLTATVL